MEHFIDFDDDSDGDHEAGPQRRMPHAMPLQHFLRIIAGGHLVNRDVAHSNDELVHQLQQGSNLHTEASAAAMRICSRAAFVPAAYREDAFVDAPIRVEEHDFNISAPHMHATMLEALELSPGFSVLDVGTGCGLMAAYCSVVVGKRGSVVGIDVRRECIDMSRESVQRLQSTSTEFAAGASISFEVADVFLLGGSGHIGKYDRVYVGASCPADHLHFFVDLLKPEGGVIVVPVCPSDLRVITKRANGGISQRVISQVRFSELEVPSDTEIVMATLRSERKARLTLSIPPSTYEDDAAAIANSCRWKNQTLSSSPVAVLNGMPHSPGAATNRMAILPAPDCAMVGPDGWEIPVHSVVLRQRCDHFRARCDSGMCDAKLDSVHVPDHFSQSAVGAFLKYLYHDQVEFDPETEAVEVLHLAQYYGVPRLAQMCERILARVLRTGLRSEKAIQATADSAASLLALAFDHSLPHLKAVALDFIVSNYEIVSQTESYRDLGKEHVEIVAQEACRLQKRCKDLLGELGAANKNRLPDP